MALSKPRFFNGIGGSALAIGGAILAGCWRAEERGKFLSFYYIFPYLGLAVGPIVGGFVVQHTTWRWMFYATSILSATIQAIGVFAFPETYAPKILGEKAERLRKEKENPQLHTEYEQRHQSTTAILQQAFVRPCKLLGTQPIVQVLALYIACVWYDVSCIVDLLYCVGRCLWRMQRYCRAQLYVVEH